MCYKNSTKQTSCLWIFLEEEHWPIKQWQDTDECLITLQGSVGLGLLANIQYSGILALSCSSPLHHQLGQEEPAIVQVLIIHEKPLFFQTALSLKIFRKYHRFKMQPFIHLELKFRSLLRKTITVIYSSEWCQNDFKIIIYH